MNEGMFLETLRELHDGQAIRELNDALRSVVQAGRIVGKGGSVTLKLTVTPLHNDSEGCTVGYKIDTKEPVVDPKPVFFFVTESDELTRINPLERQRRMPGTD